MSGHSIEIEFTRWGYNLTAVCNEPPESDCHLESGCDCEEWGAIHHRPDGTIWHRIVGEGPMEPLWHQVTRGELCNVCEWLNGSDVAECFIGESHHKVTFPIKPVWSGDGYEWEPLP